ncbi:MAG: MBL fold metallo-hydrolase [Methanomassiliicoccaceae archaeon]|jgi:7,8-dihydropterin-6-yl-methyl-4-(beta-D-ribofuranosyl)aminobenzene 5'-phosphate synthase|nr:MBL fold metallo-hydrolase [Methanomassiliicoccaceae archaeon]
MKARVLSVYDEGALTGTPLIGAKGLSIFIDADDSRTLFDTGLRGNYLIHNMDRLDIDPDSIDRVVISHVHKEHTGGLAGLLEKREKSVDVIITPDCEYVSRVKFLGIPIKRAGLPDMPEKDMSKMNLRTVSEWTQLSKNLFLTGKVPSGTAGGPTKEMPDESSLVLMTRKGPVLICGCCHHGIETTAAYVEKMTGKKVHTVIGGLHLHRLKKREVHEVADRVMEMGSPLLYASHCTGESQTTHLREKLGLNGVKNFYVGTEIFFDI